MDPTKILRIASILAFLQFIAHTAMFLSAKPHHGPAEVAVIEAMKSHHFNFLGWERSYWDFYYGYGLFAAFNVLIETVLFWQLATLAKTESRPHQTDRRTVRACERRLRTPVLEIFLYHPNRARRGYRNLPRLHVHIGDAEARLKLLRHGYNRRVQLPNRSYLR